MSSRPSFDRLFEIASVRKGSPEAFEATLPMPQDPDALAGIPDDRWLSTFSKCVFQSGFNWKVVESKWPRFEEVFQGFDIGAMTLMSDEGLDRYLKAEGIVRHAKKILSIRGNAAFLQELAVEHGSGGAAIAHWPGDDFAGLLQLLKARGSRLGGATGQYALRFMGVDGYVLSRDVVRALIRDGVVDKAPSGKRDMATVQAAFNQWREESGRPFMHISRVLACSIE